MVRKRALVPAAVSIGPPGARVLKCLMLENLGAIRGRGDGIEPNTLGASDGRLRTAGGSQEQKTALSNRRLSPVFASEAKAAPELFQNYPACSKTPDSFAERFSFCSASRFICGFI